MHNAEVATLFHRVVDLLELADANTFRVRADRSAARTVCALPRRASMLAWRAPTKLERWCNGAIRLRLTTRAPCKKKDR
jgi:DNA polymerase/3'-5' exonuclease PolX